MRQGPRAPIYAKLVGYGAKSDGYNMVVPLGMGGEQCMELAMDEVDQRAEEVIK